MTLNIQMVVDCINPHELADWWAETLDWAVEPQDEGFIRSMIEQGFATGRGNHDAPRQTRVAGRRRHPAARQNSTPKPPARRILFQTAPEGKTVKNRVHWDVRLAGADKDAVRAALEARGATFLWSASQGPHSWHTMADPEGNEFCIS